MDTFEIAQAFAQPDAGDALKLKWGKVTAISGNKVSVRLPGATSDIKCVAWTPIAVGCSVAIICKGAIWIAVSSDFKEEPEETSYNFCLYGENYTAGTVKARTNIPLKGTDKFYYTNASGTDVALSHSGSNGTYTITGIKAGMSIWIGGT